MLWQVLNKLCKPVFGWELQNWRAGNLLKRAMEDDWLMLNIGQTGMLPPYIVIL
jgi:hypothetical protein